MKVSAKKWQESSIPRFLDIFTGFMGEILQKMPVENTEKFSTFMTPLFWRWYFTRLSSSDDVSPAARMEYFHQVENWPRGTMFFVIPSLSVEKMSATIEAEIELISFYEQPLLATLAQDLSLTHYFSTDTFYKNLVNELRLLIQKQVTKDVKITTGLIEFWRIFITSLLSHWWGNDPFISQTFSLKQFVTLMESFLSKIYTSHDRGVTSDYIFDTIISLVRKKFPGWALTTVELEAQEKERQRQKEVPRLLETMSEATMKNDTFYALGTQFDMYFITPLSQYLLLLEPYYQEIGDFQEEVAEISADPRGEPRFVLAKPPASIRVTPLGRYLFSLIQHENIAHH